VIDGHLAAPRDTRFASDLTVTPGYLPALGVPLIDGRGLASADAAGAPLVVLVNATMARRYWPNASPLGARLRLGDEPTTDAWRTVVGVVGDIRNDDIDQPPTPYVFVPHAQRPVREMTVVVRTRGAPEAAVVAARAVVASVDPDLPVYGVQTMEQVLEADLRQPTALVGLTSLFALVALTLAAVGIYGVVERGVAQRTQELGVRMALGASVRSVVRLVLRQGLTPVLVGAACGAAAGAGVARVMRGILYGVTPGDPSTYLVAGGVLVAVAALACIAPARRAAHANPLVALRSD
jgi:putative ABC transport system permease protein